MSKSNAYENDSLNLLFNATPIALVADNTATTPLTNLRIALHTGNPDEAGDQSTNEAAYGAYVRVNVARSTAGWTASVAGSTSPVANIDFAQATSGSETITHFSIGTATSGAGKVFYYGTVTPNITVSAGVQPRLTTASTVTED
jgi:hypothetical protein